MSRGACDFCSFFTWLPTMIAMGLCHQPINWRGHIKVLNWDFKAIKYI